MNIPNAYGDLRFDPSVDDGLSFKHKSILCMAIKNSLGQIIGVIQLINKFDGLVSGIIAFFFVIRMSLFFDHFYKMANICSPFFLLCFSRLFFRVSQRTMKTLWKLLPFSVEWAFITPTCTRRLLLPWLSKVSHWRFWVTMLPHLWTTPNDWG